MRKAPLTVIVVLLGLLIGGCRSSGTASQRPTVTTGFAANREERMQTVIDDLKAKGYSEERATRIAAKEVPALETTYTESLASVFTGKAVKDKAEQEKFEKDFAKSAK